MAKNINEQGLNLKKKEPKSFRQETQSGRPKHKINIILTPQKMGIQPELCDIATHIDRLRRIASEARQMVVTDRGLCYYHKSLPQQYEYVEEFVKEETKRKKTLLQQKIDTDFEAGTLSLPKMLVLPK